MKAILPTRKLSVSLCVFVPSGAITGADCHCCKFRLACRPAAWTLRRRRGGIIESIGLIAVAVVALRAQTIVEEEVIRETKVSTPTRVRRYLSRFWWRSSW
jgi:hypothetical protein